MLGAVLTPTNLNFALVSSLLGLSIYITLRTGLFSLANAGFMAIGAYMGALMTMRLDAPLWLSCPGRRRGGRFGRAAIGPAGFAFE